MRLASLIGSMASGQVRVPASVQTWVLRRLLRATADALGCQVPRVSRMNPDQILEVYARFSAREVDRLIQNGDCSRIGAIERALFDQARRGGEWLAMVLSLTGIDDTHLIMRLSYRILGIEFSGDAGTRTFLVSRCYFSTFYSAETCKVMSALDCGFAAGLSGGRSLRFVQRMTENKPCCRAEWLAVDAAEGRPMRVAALLRSTGLMRDERLIHLAFPAMRVTRTDGGIALVTGSGTGGTTTETTGNAVRADEGLGRIGVGLDEEFDTLSAEIPISVGGRDEWQPVTSELARACDEIGLEVTPLPKYGEPGKCTSCGNCVLGCRSGAGWDSRWMLSKAVARGARLLTRHTVERVILEQGRATGVVARRGGRRVFMPADLVILAAGGIGSPRILISSGIGCSDTLFVDPVLSVGARFPGAHFYRERPMAFSIDGEGYFISPYFDYLSYFFSRQWRKPIESIVGLMVKLADTPIGGLSGVKVLKSLTGQDKRRLEEGVSLCREILIRAGARRDQVFEGIPNAGHPGGMLALTSRDAASMHPQALPPNVYEADASLIPGPFGKPPTLTVMALATKVAKVCLSRI